MLLLILLFVCHFLADFSPLSTPWMLAAKSKGKPYLPILVHAAVHGLLMGIIILFFDTFQNACILASFQIICHFSIDVWKGKMGVWFPAFQDSSKSPYWYLFGFDQLLHQLVIIGMYGWLLNPVL